MHEAKTRLSQLVEQAAAGEDVVIHRRGKPAAKLVPIKEESDIASLFGVYRDEIWMADDFGEWPDDVAESLGLR